MIKNFQLLIHQVLDNVELNEKTFRDHGSGFVVVKKNYKFREKLFKKTEKELDNLLKRDSIWSTLKAFKNKKLFVADGNQFFNRPGPRLIESIEIFAEIIHPELFNFKHEKKGWINFINN